MASDLCTLPRYKLYIRISSGWHISTFAQFTIIRPALLRGAMFKYYVIKDRHLSLFTCICSCFLWKSRSPNKMRQMVLFAKPYVKVICFFYEWNKHPWFLHMWPLNQLRGMDMHRNHSAGFGTVNFYSSTFTISAVQVLSLNLLLSLWSLLVIVFYMLRVDFTVPFAEQLI